MKILINILAIAFENYFMFEMLCKFKNIKDKKILFYFGLLMIYFTCGLIINFNYSLQIYFYIIYTVITYFLLKFLYKDTEILDIFIINLISTIMMITSISILTIIQPYEVSFICYIIALTIILKLKINYNGLYKKYINLWSRRDDGRIKALTVRNLSLYFINLTIFMADILLPYIKFKSGR